MPSTSAKQHRFMEWIAHDPSASKETGVPKSVAQEYVQADKKKLADGLRKRKTPM